jgi:hypothetical protein
MIPAGCKQKFRKFAEFAGSSVRPIPFDQVANRPLEDGRPGREGNGHLLLQSSVVATTASLPEIADIEMLHI